MCACELEKSEDRENYKLVKTRNFGSLFKLLCYVLSLYYVSVHMFFNILHISFILEYFKSPRKNVTNKDVFGLEIFIQKLNLMNADPEKVVI